jgi:polysaccharide export outer membrane protein
MILLTSCSVKEMQSDIFANYDEVNINVPEDYLEEMQFKGALPKEALQELERLQKVKRPTYHLGPNDKFHFKVYEEDDLTRDVIIVKLDGTVTIPLAGDIQVEGLTMDEAITKIEKALTKYIKFPRVMFEPFEMTSAHVTVLGKVDYPNTYEISGNMRLADVIAKAGGPKLGFFQNNTTELADLERAYIVRNNKVLPVDFQELIDKGNMLHNIPILDGDYIYLPSAINKEVYVIGEVTQQGHFAYKLNMTLMQAIAFAEGFTTNAKGNVFVLRGGLHHPRIYRIDTKAILQAKIMDFPLKPNDIVYVPRTPLATWNQVLAMVMPSLQAVQTTWLLNDMIRGNN